MTKIIHKLNLNKTPQLVESNSIVYAKNIKLLKDSTIGADSAIELAIDTVIDGELHQTAELLGICAGVDNNLYLFIDDTYQHVVKYAIYQYNEQEKYLKEIQSAWTYSGGIIEGYTTINHTGETILTINEYFNDNNSKQVPLKHININRCSKDDDESIYTQAPNIPITNLLLQTTYQQIIPNGVYQFFIRYKIRENFYTNWFPCSSELFAGTRKTTKTIQGQITHINTNIDAGKSFVFQVEHIFNGINNDIDYTKSFQNYQIGFILSHDDSTVARSWKSFTFDVDTIYFDYDKNSIQEEDIDELLKITYNLYNVKNVTYFKNKLYISNYKETDFNPQLQKIAKDINISLVQKETINSNIYINNTKLTHSTDTEGTDYYDRLGNKSVSTLFDSDLCNNSIINNTESEYSSKDNDKGAYTAYLTWDSNINPDVCWVNKATSELVNSRLGFQGRNDQVSFDLGTNWKDYLINTSGWWYKDHETTDANTHPWNKISNLAHCWFIASNYADDDTYQFNVGTEEILIGDNGFTYNNEAVNKVKNKLDNIVNNINAHPNICIGVYITSNNNTYYITGSKDDINNITDVYNIPADTMYVSAQHLMDNVKRNIKEKLVGITNDGVFGIKINDVIVPIDSYTVVYSTLNANSTLNHNYTIGKSIDSNIRVTLTRTNHIITYNCKIYDKYITKQNNKIEQYRTLIPFTDYEFYIHFVQSNGITTNGYLIDTKQLSIYDVTKPNSIIYPIFNNITIPRDYASCFISINKTNNNIAQIFNHSFDSNYHYADCIELDTLLYNLSDNITIIDSSGNTIATDAKYYTSSDSTPVAMLGNCGTIRWDNKGTNIDKLYSSIQLEDITINSIENPDIDGIQLIINGIHDIAQYLSIDNTKKINTNRILSTYKNLQITTEYNFGNNNTDIALTGYDNIADTYKALNVIIKNNTYVLNKNQISNIQDIAKSINGCFVRHFHKSITSVVRPSADYVIVYQIQNYNENTDVQIVGITNNDETIVLDNITIPLTKWNTATIKTYTTPGSIESIKAVYSKNNIIDIDKNTIEYKEASPIPVKNWWIKINTKQQNDNNKRLIKITPYLIINNYSLATYDNPDYLNLPGYKCDIKKLTRAFANSHYVSGTDVYTKDTSGDTIKLTITNDYQTLSNSITFTILSNFNLSYLANSEDINSQIRTFTDASGTKSKQILTAVESLTNSFILELPNMYKDYTRKYYSVYNTNSITDFTNTIRASNSNIDETYRNIYTFDATNYYNCPTNRGDIISLFSINNSIYVHTEHSLYKFSGNNSLNSEQGTVSLKEGEAFDTGITEIFDSQYGYAGLQKKSHSLVTFSNYVFYDALAKTIYAFGGNNNLIEISDPIRKLLDWLSPTDMIFAEDVYNDRFFINIISQKGNVCLSFNTKTNTFVSIHDFTFTNAISTRINTYFINNISNGFIYAFNHNAIGNYSNLYRKSAITISDESDTEVESCIDIIYTDYYETVKVLNYISWISNNIKEYYQITNNNCAEESIEPYAGTKIRIYSDQCNTKLIDLVDNDNNPLIQNNQNLTDPNNYIYPRYNCGVWTINYFRDIKNVIDIYNYKNTTNDQDKSLLYGKYFVVRLIYKGVNFKLENIQFNIQDYEQA